MGLLDFLSVENGNNETHIDDEPVVAPDSEAEVAEGEEVTEEDEHDENGHKEDEWERRRSTITIPVYETSNTDALGPVEYNKVERFENHIELYDLTPWVETNTLYGAPVLTTEEELIAVIPYDNISGAFTQRKVDENVYEATWEQKVTNAYSFEVRNVEGPTEVGEAE